MRRRMGAAAEERVASMASSPEAATEERKESSGMEAGDSEGTGRAPVVLFLFVEGVLLFVVEVVVVFVA